MRPKGYGLLVAAGRSSRMSDGKAAENKVFLPIHGRAVLEYSLKAFEDSPCIDAVALVVSPKDLPRAAALAARYSKLRWLALGGKERQDSVYNGLKALPAQGNESIVLVQDGARPFLSPTLIESCYGAVMEHGSCVAASRVSDTIKALDGNGAPPRTLRRADLRAVQTPQAFWLSELKKGYEVLFTAPEPVTDDAAVLERLGKAVHLMEYEGPNLKITKPEDLLLAQALLGEAKAPVTGFGLDVHRLVSGRKLTLCGVDIPFELGLEGHSDADVAVHALIDAILGAAALGDIGRLFPDSDERYRGVSSMLLLKAVNGLLEGRRLLHADITLIAQRPKLAPFMPLFTQSLQKALPDATISVKATTTEGLGFTGRGEGIAAQAVVTLC
ncbi:MAG: 2-C-methyl-D-erythritol 4-phosphate cytidylyltransferase [Christensenellaceae bacterium]|jgi:2-C-methyl-D-erythritol 4-phosphate cytidylyltransferase/2-C-methyl-D-erythritol 2,4-cyclodiphosphate synthase|nr:2-C-methyl-D-erythritol 4-phosphate cytidylyltransferase [Christensenellaceae bacterium]